HDPQAPRLRPRALCCPPPRPRPAAHWRRAGTRHQRNFGLNLLTPFHAPHLDTLMLARTLVAWVFILLFISSITPLDAQETPPDQPAESTPADVRPEEKKADDKPAESATTTAGPLPGHSYHWEVFDEGPRQKAYLIPGMPKIHFPVTTKSAEAQAFVEQG